MNENESLIESIDYDNSNKFNDTFEVDYTDRKIKNYFWQKWAMVPDDENEDKCVKNEISESPNIREVIRSFESRIMGKKILFENIHPKNSSVKKWISTIFANISDISEKEIEYIIDDFRSRLYTTSKTRYKNIVGVLLLNDLMLIIHCKKAPSLVETEQGIITAKQILSSDNVIRAAIIKNEDGKLVFLAYEKTKKWSKGHAEFWGIDPEYVAWELIGSIYLTIEIDGFRFPVQLPLDSEEFDEMIKDRNITPTGGIQIDRLSGKITKGRVLKLEMEFPEFYEYYVMQKIKLEEHKKKFKELIKPFYEPNLAEKFEELKDSHRYEEDITKVYEITTNGKRVIHDKTHPRFCICFFTNRMPKIKPTQKMTNALYTSIFQNNALEIWHAGEESFSDPISLGSLNIYNKIDLNQQFIEFSSNFLNIIQDTQSKKTQKILQKCFCLLWKKNLTCNHLNFMFDLIIDSIIDPDIEFEFGRSGILDKENFLEFKSASDVDTKPARFVRNTLIPTIKKYFSNSGLERYCILYGIEDSGEIVPIYRMKSDQLAYIEKQVNNEFKSENIQISVQGIPFDNKIVLLVILIPIFSS